MVTLVPGGESFDALSILNESRADGRSPLRVSFPFVMWQVCGLLVAVHPRGLSVSHGGRGRCYVWSDLSQPLPGVWAWTAADERAA